MLVDSHAHLDDARFADDREAVLERARDAGVRTILTIGNGTGPDDMGCGAALAAAYDGIYATVGVHPHDAAAWAPRHLAMMEEAAAGERVVAIGEAGLDFHYDHSPRDVQVNVFRIQAELAVRLDLPLVVHTRDAEAATLAVLEDVAPRRGVVHCFTGGEELARRVLELGWMISFSGILTFKGADAVRAVARTAPEDRILVETDAPYLAPAPHRGKRNEPAFVTETARALADLRGVPPSTIAQRTLENFHELFGVA